MNDQQNQPIIVGISGSSGVAIAEKTIDRLLQEDVPVITVCSNYAKLVWHQPSLFCQALKVFFAHLINYQLIHLLDVSNLKTL